MSLNAVNDMVIVEIHYKEKKGNIIIAETSKKYNADYYGEVISIGPENKKDIKIGDKIMFPRHEGIPIEYEEKTYYALKNHYVEGVLRED